MIKLVNLVSVILIASLFFSREGWAQEINLVNENGQKTGVWKKYYDNGNLRYEGQFKDGKEVGVFKFYSMLSKTQPVIIKEFSESSDTAKVKFYITKGTLKSEGAMLGKKRLGKWLYFFSDGKLLSEENYVDGYLDGELKNFYTNQKLTEVTEYKKGKKHGVSKIYAEDGVLIEEVMYADGLKNGEGKYFDLKGNLKEKGMYKDDKRVGKWEFYIDGEIAKKKKEKLSDIKNKN